MQTFKIKSKKNYYIRVLFTFLLSVNITMVFAQDQVKHTLSGHIRDMDTGEELIQANVYAIDIETGVVSNLYGFYSMTLPEGKYNIEYSYLGYESIIKEINLTVNTKLSVDLQTASNLMSEVTIVAEEKNKEIKSTEMSKVKINVEAIKKMPALLGEVDIIKAIQLLPGVASLTEGTSGFYVRGGNADQNLVILDEAPIYNASHMLGFFSSFNPDAIKDMQLYKGAMPARYGGRLSSVLDIRMKEGNSKKFSGNMGIGSIMSRLSLESPLGDRGSFIVSGRRSYLDVLANLVLPRDSTEESSTFYFYDLNAKGNYRFGENDRLFLSGYVGRDVIDVEDGEVGITWGNSTATARWNHIFSPKLFSNLTFYYSNYDYNLRTTENLSNFEWRAKLREWSGKADFTYYVSPSSTINFGGQAIKHFLTPGDLQFFEQDTLSSEFKIQKNQSLENAVYLSNTTSINDNLEVNVGMRFSSFHNLGPQTHYKSDVNSEILDSTVYESGFYKNHYGLEPRVGLRYQLGEEQSIKLAYNRTFQYIQQASNGNSSTPFDIWFTASPNVLPQRADQFSLGYFRNFLNNTIKASAEVYYKDFSNSIDFRERASLLLNKNLEGDLRYGKAKAYGLELMLKKDKGKFTGWISYTYSKVQKQIDTINDGEWYNAKYDKPHDFSVVANYQMNKQWSLSSNFVLSSGSPITFPTGSYIFEGSVVPIYSERNAARLPVYHRLDFSASYKPKDYATRAFKYEWVFSIYNVYNRKNAFAINFKQEESNPQVTYAEKQAVFSIVPSVTFNASF